MIILKEIFSFLGASLLLISTFSKDKKHMLKIQTGDCICNAIAGLLAGSFAATTTNILSGIRNLICVNKKVSKTFSVCYALLILMVGILVNKINAIGYIPAIASFMYTIWIFIFNSPQSINIGLIINLLMWCVHDLYMQLYPIVAVEIIIIISCVANVLRKPIINNQEN